MNVFSGAAWGGSDGSVAGRVPGVRANSLISCASASLTGWSRGMGVKLAWLWPSRVRRPASAIPCSLTTVAQEAPEAAQAAESARVSVSRVGLNVWSGQP